MGFTGFARQFLVWLFTASTALAITAVDRGTGGNTTSETSTVIVPPNSMAAGSTGFLFIGADNANGATSNFPTSITDSVGNKWFLLTHLSTASANSNVEFSTYIGYLATALTTSNNITVTYVNGAAPVTAKAWTLTEAVPSVAGNVVVAIVGFGSVASATAAPTINTTAIVSTGDLVIGFGCAESPDTWVGDSDTLNGSWSTKQSTGFGLTTSAMSVISQSKILTAVGSQTYNPTLTAADIGIGVNALTEGPAKLRGVGVSNASTSSQNITISIPIAAGSTAAWMIATDNAGTGGTASNFPSTTTDSNGSTWTKRENGIFANTVANTGVELVVYTLASNPTILNPGATIAVTYATANTVAKGSAIFEFSDATAYSTGGVGTGATTGTPSVTSSTSITNGDYIIGVAGAESANTWTKDSDTVNGSWSDGAEFNAGTGIAGMSGIFQYKKVTATATQTFNPTCTSADTMIQWTELTAPPISTIKKYLSFFDSLP